MYDQMALRGHGFVAEVIPHVVTGTITIDLLVRLERQVWVTDLGPGGKQFKVGYLGRVGRQGFVFSWLLVRFGGAGGASKLMFIIIVVISSVSP